MYHFLKDKCIIHYLKVNNNMLFSLIIQKINVPLFKNKYSLNYINIFGKSKLY